jgi:hypothetical protein
MPSINTYAVIPWQVDWDGRTPLVNPLEQKVIQIQMFLADGATSTDAQVLMQYLDKLADGEQKQARKAIKDGLVTVVPVSKAQVTAPPVPLHVKTAGPPADRGKAKD